MKVLITGAAGFIGSYVAMRLQQTGNYSLILVDDFSNPAKMMHHQLWDASHKIHRDQLFSSSMQVIPDVVLHLGARTDTAETDTTIFDRLNVHYSQQMWQFCALHQIPLIYASSAATYGNGSLGYSDNLADLTALKPLNAYGWSKQQFDVWAHQQTQTPPQWYGLKFFNVYGPHESHKGRMASVIFHAFHQIRRTQSLKLFKSHRPDFADGMQQRDFIFVEDIFRIIQFLMHQNTVSSGILNAGTGQARTFLDLSHAVFSALNLPAKVDFMDIPVDIREAYQYFTEADVTKLRSVGYQDSFTTLEDGVNQYINYLLSQHDGV